MSIVSEWNQAIVEEFRANGGEVGGRFTGRNLLLLHTIGKKSGEERINPVAYVHDGDRYVIIASKGGAPTHPDWYYNLIDHPDVTIEVGTETLQVQAAETQEPERSRLYEKMVEMMPSFGEYRQKTTRIIPVFVLTKVS
jgi:deazaflavin-dependent oxidoreductase (nitroreductase family)